MQVTQLILNITSEDPERLGEFYRNVVQLEPNPQVGEHAFKVGNATFIIDGHSETKGAAREPHRVLINFMVDDIAAEEARLEAQGVRFIRKQGREYWGGVISTFLDSDGNYAQLMEFKPAEQPATKEQSMDTEQNKATYRAFIQQVFNEGRLDVLDEFLAPSYVIRDAPPGTPAGAEGVKQAVSMFRGGFPDLDITLDDLIAEGDWVAARSTLRGTHQGPLFGIAPTGRSVAITSLTMVRIVDNRLVESWVKNDTASLMNQLGANIG